VKALSWVLSPSPPFLAPYLSLVALSSLSLSSPPRASSHLLVSRERSRNREPEPAGEAAAGRMERRRKAMWLYPKVVGFNPPERWGHSACFFEGVVYVFGVRIRPSTSRRFPAVFFTPIFFCRHATSSRHDPIRILPGPPESCSGTSFSSSAACMPY